MADSGSAPPAALLLDIDGTLISTGGASDRAWRRAFLELHGVDVNVPEYTGKGVPDPEVGLECFRGAIGRDPEGDEMAKLIMLRQRYLVAEVETSPGYRVMPGVEALLRRLTGEGRLVGLITGNTEPAAHIKLARADLNRYFAFGGYGSDADERVDVCRKALDRAARAAGGRLDRDGSIAVGDTPLDVEAGHGAAVKVLGVATGEYSVEQLRDAGADWAVATLEADNLPF
ncbi:MAG: haloacid dehalogenase [Solirubrobacterales bacterium]|nr:haloacid dehalogenase [Solirubrobacterales bacterium]